MTQQNADRLVEAWDAEFDSTVAFFRSRVKDAPLAEDLAMLAFTKLGEAMERGVIEDPSRQLGLINHGLLVDHFRTSDNRPKHVSLEELTENMGATTVPFRAADQARFTEQFDAAVRALPEEERDAYILTDLRGLTDDEAADVLGVSRATVKRRIQPARDFIRKELA